MPFTVGTVVRKRLTTPLVVGVVIATTRSQLTVAWADADETKQTFAHADAPPRVDDLAELTGAANEAVQQLKTKHLRRNDIEALRSVYRIVDIEARRATRLAGVAALLAFVSLVMSVWMIAGHAAGFY